MERARDLPTAEDFGLPAPPSSLDPIGHAVQSMTRMVYELASQGLVDPAFAYAYEKVERLPLPRGRKFSRHMARELQQEWNAAVDQYILRGDDSRPREVIERATKVGTWHGALIKTCEGPGCGKVERSDVAKLMLCSRCHFSAYCSSKCQKSAWKEHKITCGGEDQREQALPSQTAIQVHILDVKWRELEVLAKEIGIEDFKP
ncbi:hypothetical protein PLICRDRAFT_466554 [Plicaturopsis crispa FD-325 SS-3]|nr:hypothetical protein PLICRDRAFT_466554 [Plicaturopsis crispa FD-325 SS-3]